MGFRVDGKARDRRLDVAGERVEQRQALDFFIEQLYAQRDVVRLAGKISITSPRTRKVPRWKA